MQALATAIAELLSADPLWRELDLAFRTIKGVADRTVARIMAEMPEIGTLSNKAISKLAGLAPLLRTAANIAFARSFSTLSPPSSPPPSSACILSKA